MSDYALELRGITKIYGEAEYRANNRITLDLRKGEILCLAGENGAGKSTLMKILYGLTPPTEGEIRVWGKPVTITSPKKANALGIGMAHQRFMLFPEFTAAQNVVMGAEPKKWGIFYDFKQAEAETAELIKTHRFSIKANDRVGSLSVGQMQQVEILKMLYRKAEILILDEPTAVLTEQETAGLFKTLKGLAAEGKSLILITHKLAEIKRVADRVAVMRQGELAGIREIGNTDEYAIFRMMIGKEPSAPDKRRKRTRSPGPEALIFDSVTVKHRSQERPLLDSVSFTVRRGEIVGFAGAGGNGLEALEAVLGGLLPISSGRILCGGEDISGLDARGLRRRGLAYVPADRLHLGSALEASVPENIMLGRREEFVRGGFLDVNAVSRFSRKLFERYGITGNEGLRIGSLSGGNIQKVILAREIDLFRDYIVFSEPTWGLDAASGAYVYKQMSALREKGAAVLLISSNLDEILANADRILVFYRGSVAAEITQPETNTNAKEIIGAYMLGINMSDTLIVSDTK
ncbi:MAG: ABC transporter ATP-binding protein [Spirochaetaceae bacterium]|jgi:simple sugar transport system ATP-binding protein|nr:ABC transporter ATP-binding protein [Spirochaetaceae bacterium]